MRNCTSSAQEIVQRLLPSHNGDADDRVRAWNEWLLLGGSEPVLRFIRWTNSTSADDDEILQETLILAYVKVENGAYQDRDIPFTAFLKKIAWYKIMEASRRYAGEVQLDEDIHEYLAEDHHDQEQVEYWKEREALRQAMAKLPPRRSRIIWLYESGFSTSEIAEQLRIKEELVRKEKSLGLRQLRETMTLALAG